MSGRRETRFTSWLSSFLALIPRGRWHCLCFLICKVGIKIVCTQFLRELNKSVRMKYLTRGLEWGEAAGSRTFSHCMLLSLLHHRSGCGSQPDSSGGPSLPVSAGQQQLRLSGGPELRLCQQELRCRRLRCLESESRGVCCK